MTVLQRKQQVVHLGREMASSLHRSGGVTNLEYSGIPSGNQTWLVGKSPMNGGVWLGKSLMNGPFSIAMFDYRRVDCSFVKSKAYSRVGANLTHAEFEECYADGTGAMPRGNGFLVKLKDVEIITLW